MDEIGLHVSRTKTENIKKVGCELTNQQCLACKILWTVYVNYINVNDMS